MKAKRITTTQYKFNAKHGGFQPTGMTVTVEDVVETERKAPEEPTGEEKE